MSHALVGSRSWFSVYSNVPIAQVECAGLMGLLMNIFRSFLLSRACARKILINCWLGMSGHVLNIARGTLDADN